MEKDSVIPSWKGCPFRYWVRSVLANNKYLLQSYRCSTSRIILPAKKAPMENPMAIVLLRKADEIIKAMVTYMTVDTLLSIYVFHRLRTIFFSTICPSAFML